MMAALFVRASAFVCAVLLGACGGGGAGSAPAEVPTLDALVAELESAGLGCDSLEPNPDKLFVREFATCTTDGERIGISTYGDRAAMDTALESARQFGGILVVGELWVMAPESQATADRIQQALGGEVR